MTKFILSIDWDHTLRKMNGIDLTILACMFYAEAAHIPFGLTTHRDKENTTLYMYSPWLYSSSQDTKSQDIHDALAASISFWHEHLFSPLNLKFDFINARYQPLFKNENYYETQLLSLENELRNEILNQSVGDDRGQLNAQVNKYAVKNEFHMPHNDYKEKQITWLYQQYNQSFSAPITIVHLDDDQGVTDQLPIYSQASNGLFQVNTVHLDDEYTLSNTAFLSMLTEMGMITHTKQLIEQSFLGEDHHTQFDILSLLSACLLWALLHSADQALLVKIEKILQKTATRVPENLKFRHTFISSCISVMMTNQSPIRLLSNNLKYFIV